MSDSSDEEHKTKQKMIKVASQENYSQLEEMEYDDDETSENNPTIRKQARKEYQNFKILE